MDIFVNTANNEYFFVVLNWFGSEELLRFLQRAFIALNLISFRVKCEAIGNPAVVAAENENLLIVKGEAAHGISSTPITLTVCKLNLLPSLVHKVIAAVKALNAVEWLFILGITTANHIDEAVFEDTSGMEVTRLIQLFNFGPFVFGNLVHFTFSGCFVRIFRAYGEKEVLSTVLLTPMQVGKLMTRATVDHIRAFFHLVRFFIDDQTVIGDDSSNFMFLLFSSNAVDFIVDLNCSTIFGKDLCVTKANRCCSLRGQLVDHHLVVCVVVVMKPRFILT